MNERIRELAKQSGFDGFEALDERNFKFAELIAIECASIVYNTCQDGDAGAQAILYEFDIDSARSQK